MSLTPMQPRGPYWHRAEHPQIGKIDRTGRGHERASLSPAAFERRRAMGPGVRHPEFMDRSGERDTTAGTGACQVLFVQGGGSGTHDEWDNVLVDALRADLGPGYEVRYPRMPEEGDPSYPRWSAAIWREMADLDEGAVVAGHSIGATILVQALTERPPERSLAAIVLIAAPFVGRSGWPGDDFEFSDDLGDRLPSGVPVHMFHGTEDETAPPTHAALYADAIPRAKLHMLSGRDHQLNGDLSEVSDAIRGHLAPDGTRT